MVYCVYQISAPYFDLSQVGAPQEVVGRLCALAGELESDCGDQRQDSLDAELDEFMVINEIY